MYTPNIPLIIVTATLTIAVLIYVAVRLTIIYQGKLLESQNHLLKAVIGAQENERQRIGQDLHDEVGTTLSMLKFQIQESEIQKDEFIIQLLNEAISTVKYVTHHLAPPGISENPLTYSIRYLARSVEEKTRISVNFNDEIIVTNIAIEHKVEIYRIITEMLNNAIKHSKCDSIDIFIFEEAPKLIVDLSDNGNGFDVSTATDGIGITGIMKRVGLLGGTCVMHSSEIGTHYKVEIPLNKLT